MPADDYAATAEETHRQLPARPIPAAEGAQRPPARTISASEWAQRLPPARTVSAAEWAQRLPPARTDSAAEGAHRLLPARPDPAINLYEDYNGKNNRKRAISVESEDEDWDLPLPPPPKRINVGTSSRGLWSVPRLYRMGQKFRENGTMHGQFFVYVIILFGIFLPPICKI